MNAQIQAEQDIKTYHKVKAIRRMVIEEFLEQLKDKMDRMAISDGIAPRAGGDGNIVESENRGYNEGVAQVQGFIRELRASL